nr:immunoglobulin heavy chain junction region [Mus musculus]
CVRQGYGSNYFDYW